MDISAEELDRAIKMGKARERHRILSKLQEQIDIAAGAGDLALMNALTVARAEIALDVPAPIFVAGMPTPDAGRVADEPLAHRAMEPVPVELPPARERDDEVEGLAIARHLLRR